MLEERNGQYKPFLYCSLHHLCWFKADCQASSNPVIKPLIISLTGSHLILNAQLKTRGILNTL